MFAITQSPHNTDASVVRPAIRGTQNPRQYWAVTDTTDTTDISSASCARARAPLRESP